MSDSYLSELAQRLVIGHKRDGRSIYHAQAKRELILACREPGASLVPKVRTEMSLQVLAYNMKRVIKILRARKVTQVIAA